MITAATVTHASRIELLCLTYALFLEDIERALLCTGEDRKKIVAHSREVLLQLVESLDFKQQIAKELFAVYIYIQNILINKRDEDDKLREVYDLMNKLYQSYIQLMEQESEKQSVVEHAQQIYAGMTYGRGYLSEVVTDDSQRGFKA